VTLFLAEDRHQDVERPDFVPAAGLHVIHAALQHALEAELRLRQWLAPQPSRTWRTVEASRIASSRCSTVKNSWRAPRACWIGLIEALLELSRQHWFDPYLRPVAVPGCASLADCMNNFPGAYGMSICTGLVRRTGGYCDLHHQEMP
jgi:hypothetical protein